MTQMWIFQDLDRDLGRDLGQDFRLKFGMKFGMKFGLGVMALMLSGVPLASADQLASANQPTTAGFSGEIEMGSAMSAAPASKVASGGLASGGFDADILPANIPAGNATPLAAELASINQPNLIARQTRVQFFRQMFATPAVNLIGDQGQANDEATAGNVSGMDVAGLEASGMDVGTAPTTFSVQKAAIDSLQRKLAGRKAPNPLMPLGSVATAFHLISNGVAKLMISKLGAGHLPIYGDDGEVIGTRHATTGRLSAGRDRPQDQGQVWNNQG
jgi:hypothetical protein